MRQWIDLFEKAVRINTEDADDLTVQINPPAGILASFAANHDIVRGILAQKAYFWDAMRAYHYDVAHSLETRLGATLTAPISVVLSRDLDKLRAADDWEFNPDNPYVFVQSNGLYVTVAEQQLFNPNFTRVSPAAEIVFRVVLDNEGWQRLVRPGDQTGEVHLGGPTG